MTDRSDDYIDAFYSADATYAEQLTPPLNLSPVFEKAREKQLALSDVVISDLTQESMAAVLKLMDSETNELDRDAIEEGLMWKEVTIEGLSVKLPAHRNLFESNTSIIQTLESGSAFDDLSISHETGGQFAGFGTRFEIVPDGDTLGGVRPVIVYQVKVGSFRSPHTAGPVFAIGDVGESRVEFLDDIMRQRIAEQLTILTAHENEVVLKCVNNINTRLAKKEIHTAADMRFVGHQLNTIIASLDISKEEKYIDAALELVSCYVDLEKKYDVAVEAVLKMPRENGTVSGYTEYIPGEPLISFEAIFAGLTVMPNRVVVGNELRWTAKSTTYGVVHTEDAVWYVRLTDLQLFK